MKYLILALLFNIGNALAQNTNIKYAKLDWAPNPPADNIGWYEVEFSDGGRWITIATTQETTYTATLADITDTVPQPGLEYCFRLVAHRGGDNTTSSLPSDMACAMIPVIVDNSGPAPVTTLILTTPDTPTVRLE